MGITGKGLMMLVVGYTPRLRGDLSGLTGLLYEAYLYVCLILSMSYLSIEARAW